MKLIFQLLKHLPSSSKWGVPFFVAILSFFLLGNEDSFTKNAKSHPGKMGKTVYGRVIRVADGDTVTIVTAEKKELRIRCQGIDAPERSQDFGQKSRSKMNSLVYGKQIRVNVDKIDQHGRVVGQIWLDSPRSRISIDVEEEMLKAGLAWHYTYFNRDKKLANAQREAQRKKIGIWSMPNPTPPWEWRQQEKKKRFGN